MTNFSEARALDTDRADPLSFAGVIMAHRQSIVTKDDMAHADNALHLLFKTFADDEDQLGPAAFLQLVNEAGLLDDACGRAVPSSTATLAFSRAKLGKKNALSFDRFKEAARMVAVEKGVAYQDLVPFAVNTFRARRAAQERIDLEAATRFTVTLDRGEDRGLGVVLFIEEEIPNRLRVDEVNEDSAAGRYNAAVEKERADAAATAATAPAAPAPAAGGEEEGDDDDAAARDTDDDGEDDSGGGGQRLAIELGDYVVEVNGLVVEGRPLLEVLEEMRKPTLRLTFMRLGAPGDTGAAADEAAAAAAVAKMGGGAAGGAAAAAGGGIAAGTILKAAWLYKQGHLVKNWKRRYFEMVADADGGATLKYYGGEQQGSQMKGCFKLEPPGTVAEERGERAVGKMPGMDGGNHTMHQFAIHCGRRMLLVGAPDGATMRRWVSCCSLVITDGAAAAARAGWLGEGSAKRGAAAGTATLPQRRQSQTRGGQQRVKARMSITPYLVHATAYAAKEGWLFKQGAEGLSKRKRWFVLEGDRLKYFQGNSKAPSTLKGEIQLTANTACARQVGSESQARVDLMTEKRVYVLFASDGGKQSAEAEALMGEWVVALSNNLSVLKTANSRAAAANDSIAEEGEDGEAVAAQLGGAGAPLAGGLVRSGNLWKQGRIAKSWKQLAQVMKYRYWGVIGYLLIVIYYRGQHQGLRLTAVPRPTHSDGDGPSIAKRSAMSSKSMSAMSTSSNSYFLSAGASESTTAGDIGCSDGDVMGEAEAACAIASCLARWLFSRFLEDVKHFVASSRVSCSPIGCPMLAMKSCSSMLRSATPDQIRSVKVFPRQRSPYFAPPGICCSTHRPMSCVRTLTCGEGALGARLAETVGEPGGGSTNDAILGSFGQIHLILFPLKSERQVVPR
jgi:hypothetical protein